eukprot:11351188-Alexandrium_andersonii.AAC.1
MTKQARAPSWNLSCCRACSASRAGTSSEWFLGGAWVGSHGLLVRPWGVPGIVGPDTVRAARVHLF